MCVEYINVDVLEGIVVDNSREVRYLNFLHILKEGTSQFMHKARTILRVLRSHQVKLPIALKKLLRHLELYWFLKADTSQSKYFKFEPSATTNKVVSTEKVPMYSIVIYNINKTIDKWLRPLQFICILKEDTTQLKHFKFQQVATTNKVVKHIKGTYNYSM